MRERLKQLKINLTIRQFCSQRPRIVPFGKVCMRGPLCTKPPLAVCSKTRDTKRKTQPLVFIEGNIEHTDDTFLLEREEKR